ncbi:hypothetical protein [Nodosilinea sp. E11]|uniref:hypothetical protein n=1 Tax=Nodosilinea sp. E11 TaxID=3037479 RepID=UPI0029352066|nr:hypothetical protein [Nodosilinea sp. E11]WOD41166.1 hypothetical protein RRF56_10220 [Nodosilinea sp. E11]
MFAKTFRNTLIASGVLVGASLIAGPAALAAPDADPATSAGAANSTSATVELINRVTFVPALTTTVQPVTTQTDMAFPLGTVAIRNNHVNGWNLNVASANSGKLKMGTTHELSYSAITLAETADITEAIINPASGGILGTGDFSARVAGGTEAINVSASLTVPSNVAAGVYTDTLTFTLTSK